MATIVVPLNYLPVNKATWKTSELGTRVLAPFRQVLEVMEGFELIKHRFEFKKILTPLL
jgi:hypothetical protein